MKKFTYALILPLVVVSGLLLSNREIKSKTTERPTTKSCLAAEKKTERQKWEASPDGVAFKQWEASPAGQKVLAGIANIRGSVNSFDNMEAVITSLSLPPGSRLGFGVMARINGAEYIVQFDAEKSQLEQLRSLKINDKIIIRSHNISYAPKYSYPIVRAEYVERDGRVIFKRVPRKDGC